MPAIGTAGRDDRDRSVSRLAAFVAGLLAGCGGAWRDVAAGHAGQPIIGTARGSGSDQLGPEGDKHGVSGKFIPGADNGTTECSSDRCDKETSFMKWLFKQKKG